MMAVNFSHCGNLLFNGTRDGVIRCLDIRQNAIADVALQRHGSHYKYLAHKSSVSFSPLFIFISFFDWANICSLKSLVDDNYLLASSMDGIISNNRLFYFSLLNIFLFLFLTTITYAYGTEEQIK